MSYSPDQLRDSASPLMGAGDRCDTPAPEKHGHGLSGGPCMGAVVEAVHFEPFSPSGKRVCTSPVVPSGLLHFGPGLAPVLVGRGGRAQSAPPGSCGGDIAGVHAFQRASVAPCLAPLSETGECGSLRVAWRALVEQLFTEFAAAAAAESEGAPDAAGEATATDSGHIKPPATVLTGMMPEGVVAGESEGPAMEHLISLEDDAWDIGLPWERTGFPPVW